MTNPSRNYKIAFFFALAMIVALAAVLGLAWRNMQRKTAPSAETTNTTAPPAPSPSPAVADIPLSRVQLTPERIQSIGVKLGTAEMQSVSNEIRAAGNVEIDERRVAYVQTRNMRLTAPTRRTTNRW